MQRIICVFLHIILKQFKLYLLIHCTNITFMIICGFPDTKVTPPKKCQNVALDTQANHKLFLQTGKSRMYRKSFFFPLNVSNMMPKFINVRKVVQQLNIYEVFLLIHEYDYHIHGNVSRGMIHKQFHTYKYTYLQMSGVKRASFCSLPCLKGGHMSPAKC